MRRGSSREAEDCLWAISWYPRDIVISRPTQSERLTKVPIAFTDDLYEWMRSRSFLQRQSMAEIVREALRQYRERVDPQLGLPIEVSE